MKFQAGIIGCLVKILIAVLILALIVVLAFVILGNLKMSTLKLDTIKLGEMTLGELGLGEQKVKTVAKAAYKLVNPDKSKLVTNPIEDSDGAQADAVFASIPKSSSDNKPFYFSLIATRAEYAGDPKIELSDGELGYVLDRIISSGQENEAVKIPNAFRMSVASSRIKVENGKKYFDLTFSMDVSTITGALPNVPVLNWFYKWPDSAYLTYSAEITANAEGVLSLVGAPTVQINGLSTEDSEAVFTAVCKTKSIEPAEGKNYGQTVGESLTAVIVNSFNNIGSVANYGVHIEGNVNRDQIVYGTDGIKEGEIWFAKH